MPSRKQLFFLKPIELRNALLVKANATKMHLAAVKI